MRVVFMGTPQFAVPTLYAIVAAGYPIVAVYTRAPKPGGRRGLEITKTSVHRAAEDLRLPVLTPASLRGREARATFSAHAPDVGLVIAYGLILPDTILTVPAFGCLNLHASLLPRWRGAAPIQRAIMAGDEQTGVDLMRMDEGLDTGPIALREHVEIHPYETAGELSERLAASAAKLAVGGLQGLENASLQFRVQSEAGASYAFKIDKSETEIDWSLSAEQVRNHIHALSPMPGAYSELHVDGQFARVKVFRAEAVAGSGPPGRILDSGMAVACGEGAIQVLEAQKAGSVRLPVAEFIRRHAIAAGSAFRRSVASSSAPLTRT